MRKAVVLALWALLLAGSLSAALFVKQEKDGRIVISDARQNPLIGKLATIRRRPAPQAAQVASLRLNAGIIAKIREWCARHEFRSDLVIAVARAESSFNPNAVSHKGAMGMMQLMLGTAKDYGVQNPFNVDQNLDGGIRHLKFLYAKYRQDIPLTLAAYNAGVEAVTRFGGVPPYSETRRYVKKVMSFLGMTPPSFGLRLSARTRIYRYVNAEGKIVISDSRPVQARGPVEIFD